MRKPEWSAELSVDVGTARKLIRMGAPGIAADRVELLGEGWDNIVYRVDDDWVFRFPRRQMGADLVAVECPVLQRIGRSLSLPVPVPEHVCGPVAGYPWPYAGHRYLAGESACRRSLSDDVRMASAAMLGRFLCALHATDAARLEGTGVPGDVLGRMNLEKRLPQASERLDKLHGLGLVKDRKRWLPMMEGLVPHDGPVRLAHGDLYTCHLLVDEAGRISAVIDWGDVHFGDPAVDLLIAFSFLPAEGRDAFWKEYGAVDEPARRRARFRAFYHSLLMIDYAHGIGDESLLHNMVDTLERVGS